MVHIKRIELTNFKSFGGTTSIPVLPGFTVVSGPNGSGKSNILDALLFCLGLSTSKGMRAERLPDLVNTAQNKRGTIEASVTATFALEDVGDEWFAQDEDEDEDEIPETQENNEQLSAANPESPELSVEAEDVEAIEIPETQKNNGQSSNLKSKIQNPKSIESGPSLRLRCETKAALLGKEAARVAQKSSCTPSASLRPLLRQQK